MSRFYRIEVGAETAIPIGGTTPSNNIGAVWTNFVNGKADLGAQTVELDIHAYTFSAPVSQASVTIWGPAKAQLTQASDFNGAPIKVYAGMQNGLPLATSSVSDGQAGLILSGQIIQAFGNWQGINQTLDFVVTVDGGATQSQPANLSFLWIRGQPLSQVLRQTLSTAYPQYQVNVTVASNLVLAQNEAGVYQTLQQFSDYVNNVSQNIIGEPDYPGVSITLRDGVLTASDGSSSNTPPPVKQLNIQDLIGQPTWLDSATVQFNTVMRADLWPESVVQFPLIAGYQAVTSAQSQSYARAKNTFSGTWKIIYARHIGNSRAPNAQSWISTFQAISSVASSSATSVSNSSA